MMDLKLIILLISYPFQLTSLLLLYINGYPQITQQAMFLPMAKLPRLLFQKLRSTTKYHTLLKDSPNPEPVLHQTSALDWKQQLKEKLKQDTQKQSNLVSIYKVPDELRRVEPKAYTPSIVSIGPYHHGHGLKSTEDLKWIFLQRLFGPRDTGGLDAVVNALERIEPEARSCYSDSDQFDMSPEGFVKMMLVDGCFVVELLRELERHGFRDGSVSSVKRWMLPTLRRDLIKLENQLPLFVLTSIFNLTSTNPIKSSSLERLAIRFFNPLLQISESESESDEIEGKKHLLDLFRSSIVPTSRSNGNPLLDDYRGTLFQERQPQMIRSVRELVNAGVKIEVPKTRRRLLEVTSSGRVLRIPSLHIDDHRGTLFRNMVALEKCDGSMKPDVTTYLFFFDGLINSAGDVGVLHYKGVVEHSLGSNREVARLVNKLCKEVDRDAEESYLYGVVDDVNFYYGTWYAKVRASLVHHYFSSWVVGVSTVAAIFALYLTLVQTGAGVASAIKDFDRPHFFSYIKDCFWLLFTGKPSAGIPKT